MKKLFIEIVEEEQRFVTEEVLIPENYDLAYDIMIQLSESALEKIKQASSKLKEKIIEIGIKVKRLWETLYNKAKKMRKPELLIKAKKNLERISTLIMDLYADRRNMFVALAMILFFAFAANKFVQTVIKSVNVYGTVIDMPLTTFSFLSFGKSLLTGQGVESALKVGSSAPSLLITSLLSKNSMSAFKTLLLKLKFYTI